MSVGAQACEYLHRRWFSENKVFKNLLIYSYCQTKRPRKSRKTNPFLLININIGFPKRIPMFVKWTVNKELYSYKNLLGEFIPGEICSSSNI